MRLAKSLRLCARVSSLILQLDRALPNFRVA